MLSRHHACADERQKSGMLPRLHSLCYHKEFARMSRCVLNSSVHQPIVIAPPGLTALMLTYD